MQTFFLFALIIASVGLMVIAISKWKIHPFIVMTVIALLVGLIWGAVYPESALTPAKVVNSVKSGFGDIMTSIGIVILCGTIINTILEKTGAALTMANAILKLVGKKRSVVAMGAMGSDAAIEAADIVLMRSDLEDVPRALRLSALTLRDIKQNLFWACRFYTIGIPFAAGLLYALGGPLLSPMLAGAAMSLSSVCVGGNALRLGSVKL